VKLVLPAEEKRQDFKDYLELIKKRIEDDQDLGTILSKKEKQEINNEANDSLDWLKKTPNASVKEVREKEKKLDQKIGSILDDAEKKKKFDDLLNNFGEDKENIKNRNNKRKKFA